MGVLANERRSKKTRGGETCTGRREEVKEIYNQGFSNGIIEKKANRSCRNQGNVETITGKKVGLKKHFKKQKK